MKKEHIDLLTEWLFSAEYDPGINSNSASKIKRDAMFCATIFGQQNIPVEKIKVMLREAINDNNEFELDLLLMLIEHYDISTLLDDVIAPLLIQPWHHLHDRIAGILEKCKDENTIEFLFLGALFQCDNLDYESDYREFGRKCIYALLNIGTPKAINKIKNICNSQDKIIAEHAKKILLDNQLL